MDAPIFDFVQRYAESNTLRLHMPGHKGMGPLGCEGLDITEIGGADSLYEAEDIIAQSEANATFLFGCPTSYSTEGSSQCIRAMLHLATCGKNRKVAAARNVHKTFLSAVALLDLEVDWLYPEVKSAYLSCHITVQMLERYFASCEEAPAAVYITSPDYLGNMQDIAALATVCHHHGALLLVDNAHGAYLRFLASSQHPMDLGADLCCDSAHKTLPVLTGGAYLHIRNKDMAAQAKNALALFGSTSPSYLILQSLDAANPLLAGAYPAQLQEFVREVEACKLRLAKHGYCFAGNEPMKLTVKAKPYGYTGAALAQLLRENGIECEFADPDYLVLMPTPKTGVAGLQHLENALRQIPQKTPITDAPPTLSRPERMRSIRDALLCPAETVPAAQSLGRVLAAASVGCPPAVPIVACGERIDEGAIACFSHYGIEYCQVCK